MKLGITLGALAILMLLLPATYANVISAAQADGLITYQTLNNQTPLYRLWNISNNLTAVKANSLNVGADISWVVVRANHERDELVMGTEDKSNDINIQVYNATAAVWGALLEVSTDIPNSAHRAFDIAVEDASGDVLIVYENSSLLSNHMLAYRVWNGTGYSGELPLDSTLADSPIHWVQSAPRKGADEIMVLVHNNAGDLHAALWNGTAFDSVRNLTLSTATTSNVEQHFSFAWEGASDDGLVVYGSGNDLVYRTFSLVAPYWSNEATIALGNGLSAARACSEKNSDYIGIIWIDGGNDVNARMWDGTQILASPPAEDSSAEASGANSANVDCAWLNSTTAFFGFSDVSSGNIGLLSFDYFNFTTPNTWSVSDLTTAPTTMEFASDDIESLRFAAHPVTSEIIAVGMDSADDISLIRWNGTGFASVAESPIESSTEVANGGQEGAMFDWDRFDPVPNVTTLGPNGLNYPISSILHINASVIDNVKVGTVLAHITLPNGTLREITLSNGTGNSTFYNSTFSITDIAGTYTLKIIANDSSTHQNINSSENVTFTVGDVIAPNVTNIIPSASTDYLQDQGINITVNVTDEINISFVFVNVTAPNGSMFRLQMLNLSLVQFNVTFYHTNRVGPYSFRIIANDTTNNVNSTETSTFDVGDATSPNVTNVTPLFNPNFALNTIVNITANVTDDVNLSNVFANVTFPNGSAILFPMNNLSLRLYNVTFNATRDAGQYNITIIANDTANNYNRTEISSFTVGDVFAPNITLLSPSNGSNSSSATITFSFSATDADATFNCSLILDLIPNATNLTTNNGADTSFIVSGITEGSHDWSIRCQDARNNTNTSTTSFNVDTLAPQFVSISTVPSTAADLDPDRNVTVLANVTENVTYVSIVVLQYKLTNDTEYRNLSMTYNTLDGLYNVSFNATQNGTYNLRVFANDTLGNSAYHFITNVTVQVDRTWVRTPLIFTAVTAALNSNVSLGNLTINNTGDIHLQFNITSDSNNTRYNQSTLFNLTPGQTLNILVADVANVSGVKKVTLNISVNDTTSEPTSAVVSGNIVVASGQPVLQSRFTTPSNGARAVQQGDAGVEFVAALNNVGEGNASNVSFFFTIPDSWTITFGSSHSSYDQLNSLESEEKTIRVTIPSNFALGDHIIYINATGINGSGHNLSMSNLTFGDRLVVSVNSPSVVGGGGGFSSDSSGGTTTSTVGVAAGGGGGAVTKKSVGGITETIESTEVFSVVRGLGEATPITISNLYENAEMENIELAAVGFLGQYVVVSPPVELAGITNMQLIEGKPEQFAVSSDGMLHHLTVNELFGSMVKVTVESKPQQLTLKKGQSRFVDVNGDGDGDVALRFVETVGSIADVRVYPVRDLSQTKLVYGEQIDYFLDINAPPYLTRADFELTLMITADVVALNETAAGFARKEITEFRKLLFQVREVGEETARGDVDAANRALQELVGAGFPVGTARALLEQAEQAIAEGNYELADELVERIGQIRDEAFAAHDALFHVQEQVARAREQWLSIPHTEEALQLALVAFERGDFSTALERARAAQLQYVLETKGRVNLVLVVINYWWAIIGCIIAGSVLMYFVYKNFIGMIVSQRISNLSKEEETIRMLMKETQEKYLIQKVMSAGQYRRYIANYEQRLTKIQQLRAQLRSTQVAILKAEQGLESIRREKDEIHELLRKNQTDYFVKGAISRSRFHDVYNEHKQRLAEIEHEESVLEERLAKESRMAGYPVLAFIRRIVEKIRLLFSNGTVAHKNHNEQKHDEKPNTIYLKKSRPLPVSYSERVHTTVKKSISVVKEKMPVAVPHAKHAVHSSGAHNTDWATVSVPESVKLDVHCEKTGLELPRKLRLPEERAFAEQSQEAFDQELLRMAQSVEQEPGKEMTYLESLSLNSPSHKPGRLSEKELRKWFPGAFENSVMLAPTYQVSVHQPIVPIVQSSTRFDPGSLRMSRYVAPYPFNAELMEMLQSTIAARKSERRQFVTSFDFNLLRLLKAENKLKHADGKWFLNEFDEGLLSMLQVKK